MTDAVVFDFDGTLYSDEPAAYEQFKTTVTQQLAEQNCDKPHEQFEKARQAVKDGRKTTTLTAIRTTTDYDIDAILDAVTDAVCTTASKTDQSHMLEQYKDKHTVIFTNNHEQLVARYLEQQNRTADQIIGAETIPELKPADKAFRTCIEALPCDPTASHFIDNEHQNRDQAVTYGFKPHHPDTLMEDDR